MPPVHEFDLIARIRQRAAARGDVVLGIGDDCALLLPPPGMQLAVTMDALNAGVHFPPETAPADIGWKALAVNLSDLAAMGAQPAWGTLSLSLPQGDPGFVDAFFDGFFALAAQHGFALVGGDTTRGPLSIAITAHGLVEPGRALRRDGARVGDDIWVSGTLGDAAGALRQWQAGAAMSPALQARLDRPTPRVALGRALRGIASSCIDVSDGLLADLAHLCRASGVGAEVDVDALPASAALRNAFDPDTRRVLQAAGGDDYELCFTAAPAQRAALRQLSATLALSLSCIGSVTAGTGVRCDGVAAGAGGYQHFA
ncbi:thiamine-phosphate kinase [Thermomonas fusca]|uniref:Thiamine-monophosphate kinase n=1 Tax=Thermomonas fusca TaxID=215690 RepID=A0A5R9PD11_9GAMM|nr:thiamine-phosphate kinase [Thermomonas fusca]TLX20923.1 thiamine-phosphate kinase [Thermomonas fusca]